MDRIRWKNELLIALGFLALGVFALLCSLAMPVEEDPFLSPGLTPALISTILIVLSLALIGMIFAARKNTPAADTPSPANKLSKQEQEMNKIRTRRTIVSVGVTVLYVLLLGKLPYGLLTFLYILAFLLYFKSTSVLKSIALSAVVSILLVYSFGTLFRVVLP